MLVRRQQIDSLNQAELRKFEDRAYQSLQRHWPDDVAARGEPAARESIRTGIERAKTYGIETERDVLSYINLMYLYGDGFDQDPRVPWAGRILRDPKLAPGAKIDRLVEETGKKREEASR